MTANRKVTGRAVSIPAGLAMGAAMSILWTVAGAMIVAKLIESEVIPESALGYGAAGILLMGAFLASVTAFRKIKRQRAAVCTLAGLTYFLCLLAITALFFGGQFQAVAVTGVLILAGSGAAVLAGINGAGGKRKQRYKKPAI